MKTEQFMDRFREMTERVKENINEYRFIHTLGVANMALSLAMCYGLDPEKAYMAGLLHDCAKKFPDEERVGFCLAHGIEITDAEQEEPSLLHGKMGAYYAGHDYGVTDPEVLDAIAYHTTGYPGMGTYTILIYIADYLEPNRHAMPNLNELRQLAYRDMDECAYRIARDTVEYLKKQTDKKVDPMTERTYHYFKEMLKHE